MEDLSTDSLAARGSLSDLYRAAVRHVGRGGLIAAVALVVIGGLALLAPVLPMAPNQNNLSLRLASPWEAVPAGGWSYILGADQLGRSILARLIFGARVSLMVGLLSSLFAMTVGVLLGILAGLFRGLFEDVLMRLIDLWMGVPTLLVALVILYVTGPGIAKVIIVLAVMRWVMFARVARALTLSIRERPFFEVARAVGCSTPRLVFRHILPNMMWDVLLVFTLEIARAILSEAALSFLGLGVQPPDSSWGTMLANARSYITNTPWLVIYPGLAILATTVSMNVLVEGVRNRRRSRATTWTQES